MRTALVIAALLFLLAGCAAPSVQIREQDAIHRAPKPGWIVSEFGTIYVPPGTLADWTHEPLPLSRAATLVHERIHATRQIANGEAGALAWAARYTLEANFRWQEERLAYEAEIAFMASKGIAVASPYWRKYFVELVTDSVYRGMVGTAEAGNWYDGLRVARPQPDSGIDRPLHAGALRPR